MIVNYDNFAEKFACSRKNMLWPELEYFFSFIWSTDSLLDIWCGSGRFLQQYKNTFLWLPEKYIWIDLSENLLWEARIDFPDQNFICMNMMDIDSLWKNNTGLDAIFLIASFHHLSDISQRLHVLKKLWNILTPWGKVYMTNWNLLWEENLKKYWNSETLNSQNKFWSKDFTIKFWEYQRYYHSFDISELEFLARKNNFHIIENRVFDTGKNIISILKK
jgi:SAM-dependent methyltransferase